MVTSQQLYQQSNKEQHNAMEKKEITCLQKIEERKTIPHAENRYYLFSWKGNNFQKQSQPASPWDLKL